MTAPPDRPRSPAAWRLVRAQERMLTDWAEDGDGPFTRTRAELWRELHAAGDELRDALDDQAGRDEVVVDRRVLVLVGALAGGCLAAALTLAGVLVHRGCL